MASEDWEELTVIQLLPINSTKALPDSLQIALALANQQAKKVS